MFINGINLILLEPITKYVPVKTHRRKKRRIRKKLLRRYGTKLEFEYLFPINEIMTDGKTAYAYSPTYYRLVSEARQIARKNQGAFGFYNV